MAVTLGMALLGHKSHIEWLEMFQCEGTSDGKEKLRRPTGKAIPRKARKAHQREKGYISWFVRGIHKPFCRLSRQRASCPSGHLFQGIAVQNKSRERKRQIDMNLFGR